MIKKYRILFIFVLLLGLLIPMVGCTTINDNDNQNGSQDGDENNPPVVQDLISPTNVSLKETETYFLLSFDLVENASFYRVYVKTTDGKIIKTEKLGSSSNQYALKKVSFNAGTYVVSVVAEGDNQLFFNSPESTKVQFTIEDDSNDDPDNPIILSDYYKDAQNLKGADLKKSLRSITTSTHKVKTTYADCKKYLQNADEDPNNANNMLLFYTGESIKKTDDMNIWNREHVWAQSLGWFKTSGAGADLHHIRPCDPTVNNSRGNKKFGSGGSYYTPKDDYKGDVARIIFYLMVRYPESDSYSFTSISQSLDVLLAWNELDPVSPHEMNRNDYIQKIQGNRNPFIDYPSFAKAIWK